MPQTRSVLLLLQQRIQEDRDIVRSLNEIIAKEKSARQILESGNFAVEEKTFEPMLIAGIRMKGNYAEIGAGFARLGKAVGRSNPKRKRHRRAARFKSLMDNSEACCFWVKGWSLSVDQIYSNQHAYAISTDLSHACGTSIGRRVLRRFVTYRKAMEVPIIAILPATLHPGNGSVFHSVNVIRRAAAA